MKDRIKYLGLFAAVFCFIVGGFIQYSFADTMDSLSIEESSGDGWYNESSEYNPTPNPSPSSEVEGSFDGSKSTIKIMLCGVVGLAVLSIGVVVLASSLSSTNSKSDTEDN